MGRLFSVVIPAYNAAAFIADTLGSVARQTLRDFEAVVVDDGSSDDTSTRVRDWVAAHPQVELRLVRQENRGIGAARNRGLREARGEYVAFLDADDLWLDQKLEKAAAYLRDHGDVDLLCHDEWMEEGNRRQLLRHGPHRSYAPLLFRGNCLSTSAVVVRLKKVADLGGFSENLRFNGVEDYELWLRLAQSGARIDYLHEVLGVYRMHGGGITSRIEEHCRHYLNVVDAHYQEIGPSCPASRMRLRKRRAEILRGAGRAYLKQGGFHHARPFLKEAAGQWPFSWKTAALLVLASARVAV